MYKLKEMILMLCLILSGALCYVNGETRTENGKDAGTPVEIIESTNLSGLARGNAIIPVLNGHFLTVTFSENMGQVLVEVATTAGAILHSLMLKASKIQEIIR